LRDISPILQVVHSLDEIAETVLGLTQGRVSVLVDMGQTRNFGSGRIIGTDEAKRELIWCSLFIVGRLMGIIDRWGLRGNRRCASRVQEQSRTPALLKPSRVQVLLSLFGNMFSGDIGIILRPI
jgi:hypothetical protein